MSYLKVLRWASGEGGDAVMALALLSNPHIKSNIKIETLKLNLQGRTVINVDDNFIFPNIKKMAQSPDGVDNNKLREEIEKLKLLNENYLLKSHMPQPDIPYAVGIYPSAKTLPFLFKARFSKLASYYAINHPKLFEDYKKDKKKFIEKAIAYNKETFIKINMLKQDLIIDDLILKNYIKMEQVLELKFNDIGKEYFETWVDKQKELYWEELKVLF